MEENPNQAFQTGIEPVLESPFENDKSEISEGELEQINGGFKASEQVTKLKAKAARKGDDALDAFIRS